VRTTAPPDLNAPVGVETTASGLATKVLKRGHGTVNPGPNDTVTVHYSGWTLDGKMFDSSVDRGRPATFGVSKVIKGWTEGLQLMVEGERRRFWIPAELAYGNVPKRTGAPAGRLVFDVELLGIISAPKTPPDLTSPPADAKKTKSGLVYKVMKRGTSSTHPTDTDKVKVHYSGWTMDGKMFDSSVTRGRPATFGVTAVIKGWTEVLKLMSPGDVFRVWIPPDLAYGETPKRPGAPAGKLVFDIELISIQ
jgi:peptidylprolyl isomerase